MKHSTFPTTNFSAEGYRGERPYWMYYSFGSFCTRLGKRGGPLEPFLAHCDLDEPQAMMPGECGFVADSLRRVIAKWEDGDSDRVQGELLADMMTHCAKENVALRFGFTTGDAAVRTNAGEAVRNRFTARWEAIHVREIDRARQDYLDYLARAFGRDDALTAKREAAQKRLAYEGGSVTVEEWGDVGDANTFHVIMNEYEWRDAHDKVLAVRSEIDKLLAEERELKRQLCEDEDA